MARKLPRHASHAARSEHSTSHSRSERCTSVPSRHQDPHNLQISELQCSLQSVNPGRFCSRLMANRRSILNHVGMVQLQFQWQSNVLNLHGIRSTARLAVRFHLSQISKQETRKNAFVVAWRDCELRRSKSWVQTDSELCIVA